MAIATAEPPGGDAAAGAAGPLVDPSRRVIDYLRISVTDRCNYRCAYCMPEDGGVGAAHVARADVLSFEEIAAIARAFVALGVRRLRLTGGEPTVRRDLPALARMLRALPGVEDLALSTNGHLLDELAAPLRAAGVDRLNVSLDTLDAERFRRVTGRGDLSRVLAGLEAARAAGFSPIKINVVALRGFNDDELAALCAFAWERGFVPRFIEQMPMAEGRMYVEGALLSAAAIRDALAAAHPGARVVPDEAGGPGAGPARYHRVVTDGGPVGRFGIISPMTEHFCDTCNRARLSASGALHACLAHDDAVDLRGPLRAGGEGAVVQAIRAAISRKRDGHEFQLVGIGGPRKSMVQIGG
ncbi:MAG TPA: GTP 3',8-cyclase MoaA [Polyangia bacterium]|jgi:cyclic pyranopterin phosphate synthase|nr:GTP 3',8-cyclase MoaA [Polyangia bacterium]